MSRPPTTSGAVLLRSEGIVPRRQRLAQQARHRPLAEVASVEDVILPEEGSPPLRAYRPMGPSLLERRLCYLFVHGGGGVLGSVATYDAVGRAICAATGCAVISVEYRLAPEVPITGAVDDTVAAYRALATKGATLGLANVAIVLSGDSMGGLIAAMAATRLQGTDLPPPASLALIYPNTDLTLRLASTTHLPDNPLPLMLEDLRFMVENLGVTGHEKDLSPLGQPTGTHWPPTFIAVAERDILREEGRALAHQLASQGTQLALLELAGARHGYLSEPGISPAAQAADQLTLAMMNTFCLQVANTGRDYR